MDEVEALTELKSRISADDWRTICNYVFKERELADQALASSRNDVLEEAAAIAEECMTLLSIGTPGEGPFTRQDRASAETRAAIAAAIRARKDQTDG